MRQIILGAACVFLFGYAEADRKNSPEGVKMKNEIKTMQQMAIGKPVTSTVAVKFTSSPLRNRIRIELKAPLSKVWDLIGDLTKFPEYSSGLARVESKIDSSGKVIEYVCHFKPEKEGEAGIVSREKIRWFEANHGYASSGAQADSFGLKNDLHLVILDSSKDGTVVTWDEYYDAKDLAQMKAHFDHALGEIGENLVRRFGGKTIERYVEGK